MRLVQSLFAGSRLWVLVSSLRIVAAVAAMQVIVAILHQALFLGVASLLRGTNIHAVNAHLDRLPLGLDAVHTHLALSVITAVTPHGIAVAGAPGELLHGALPTVFLDPTLVTPGVWISAVLSRGSSLPGLFAVRLSVEVLLILLGAVVARAGKDARRTGYLIKQPHLTLSLVAAFGLLLEAQGIWAVMRMTPSNAELEALGLGYLTRTLLAGVAEAYPWLAYDLFPRLAMGLLAAATIALVPGLEWLSRRVIRAARLLARRDSRIPQAPKVNYIPARQLAAGLVCMLVIAAFLPRTLVARSSARYVPTRASEHRSGQTKSRTPTPASIEISALQQPTANPTPTPTLLPTASVRPTGAAMTATPTITPPVVAAERYPELLPIVQVRWSPARQHFVLVDRNGDLIRMRAINYNTHYTTLPKEEQLRILRRDFQKMRDAGANVITGYATFDETTLQVAKEFGISVVMPFVPDLDGDYLDPKYREQVKKTFDQFRQRFENYDSLLMWNFDDEPVHNMVERVQRPPEQVQAFSDFLLELAEYAYRTDRYHRPTWLKEPRDWYLDISAKSVNAARMRARQSSAQDVPLDPNVYAIFARSAYGAPLDILQWLPALSTRIERDMGMPFAVGEYGVLGVEPAERPDHLLQIWEEAQQATAIGSGVYTYGPFQPDPNDLTDPAIAAQLQLVDENAVPVDGAWNRLAEAWRAQSAYEKENRVRSSIPLAVAEFQSAVERYGGHPTSGPIEDGEGIRQYYVEGKRDGQLIAFTLTWNEVRNRVEFAQTHRVIFNELGDFALEGRLLDEYMKNGGYARFGAPTSDPVPIQSAGEPQVFQTFAKGWRLIQRIRP